MAITNICIIYGGKSGEHEVSLRSAASVVNNLDRKKYNIILIAIDKTGRWYLQTNNESVKEKKLPVITKAENEVSIFPAKGFFISNKKLDVNFVFPVLHGTNGEDGTIQGLLELMEIPYAGAGVLGSSLCMDKEIVKKVWISEGLKTVPFLSLQGQQTDDFSEKIKLQFGFPVFVKPARAGSSVGISKVKNSKELSIAIDKALEFDSKVLVEPAIDAREIECSVIGNIKAEAFTPGEIAPSHVFYDYDAKYTDENGAVLIIPAKIDKKMIQTLKDTAIKAYRLADVEGMARVDFFIDKKTGELLLNEVNTIPGFTNISMFSKMCEASGLRYAQMLDKIIELGFKRFQIKQRLNFSYD